MKQSAFSGEMKTVSFRDFDNLPAPKNEKWFSNLFHAA